MMKENLKQLITSQNLESVILGLELNLKLRFFPRIAQFYRKNKKFILLHRKVYETDFVRCNKIVEILEEELCIKLQWVYYVNTACNWDYNLLAWKRITDGIPISKTYPRRKYVPKTIQLGSCCSPMPTWQTEPHPLTDIFL